MVLGAARDRDSCQYTVCLFWTLMKLILHLKMNLIELNEVNFSSGL